MKLKIYLSLLADGVEQALDEIPTPAPAGDIGAAFAKMILTFGALIFLLFASYWIVRKLIRVRLEKGSGNSFITVLEKRMLSPKTMLYVVEMEGKKVLLAESQLEIKRLESFDAERDL